jgi:hypothetical protein
LLQRSTSEREKAGLAPLKLEAHLNASAQGHSDWMAETGSLSHAGEDGSSVGDRIAETGLPLTGAARWSENLAYTSVEGGLGADEADRMHEGLMGSAGHRANILDPDVSYFGIGLSVGTIEGGGGREMVFLTQNFAATDGEVLVQEEVGGQTLLQPWQNGEPVGEPFAPGDDEGEPDDPSGRRARGRRRRRQRRRATRATARSKTGAGPPDPGRGDPDRDDDETAAAGASWRRRPMATGCTRTWWTCAGFATRSSWTAAGRSFIRIYQLIGPAARPPGQAAPGLRAGSAGDARAARPRGEARGRPLQGATGLIVLRSRPPGRRRNPAGGASLARPGSDDRD